MQSMVRTTEVLDLFESNYYITGVVSKCSVHLQLLQTDFLKSPHHFIVNCPTLLRTGEVVCLERHTHISW